MLVLFVFFIMLGFPDRLHADGDGCRLRLLAFDGQTATGVRSLLVQRTCSVMTNDVLISVPLFVFMGYIDRARQYPRPTVPLYPDRRGRPARLAGGRDAR